jgi:zinc transport system permease protein
VPDFLIRAALAGFAVAAVAAPLGCLVVWRRMAYFGDATSHAALLGVAIALMAGLPVTLAVALLAAGMALALGLATAGGRYAADTLLGVFAHAALAAGLVALSLVEQRRMSLESWLFGDILAVAWRDLLVIGLGGAAILGVVLVLWRGLVTASISPELLAAEGGSPLRDRLAVTLLLAVFVAIALKIVGAVLITSLLVIPAAAARPLSRTPEGMALLAGAIGMAAVAGGLGLSWFADSPAGPSVILAAALGFAATNAVAGMAGR